MPPRAPPAPPVAADGDIPESLMTFEECEAFVKHVELAAERLRETGDKRIARELIWRFEHRRARFAGRFGSVHSQMVYVVEAARIYLKRNGNPFKAAEGLETGIARMQHPLRVHREGWPP